LHDHHIHFVAFAAARESVRLGPPEVTDAGGFTRALRDRNRSLPPGAWLRGTGYHESVTGELDRHALDAVVADRPVRVQHRSGALWVLNSVACERAGLPEADLSGIERDVTGRPTGRLWRLDGWLRDRLPAEVPDLAAAAGELLAYGVTGMTDATATDRADDIAVLAAAVADGRIPQRLIVTGGLGLPPDASPEIERGPVKLVIADHALPDLEDLATWIDTAHGRDRPVAIHCVTRVALLLALAAWDEVGATAGDRVEHAAVAGPDEARRLAALGITVVTQPTFVADRGDTYLTDVDPDEQPHLWPAATLLHHGVPLGAGTDAPFGHPDPWRAIAAAANRRTAGGAVLGAHERIGPERALELFLSPPHAPGGPPRTVAPGQPADLCLLRVPLREALKHPSREAVVATVRNGQVSTAT
jgi:predicted amidohydrolase YtcJ